MLTHLVITWLLSIRTEAEISELVVCRLSNVFYFGQATWVVVATIQGGLTTPGGEAEWGPHTASASSPRFRGAWESKSRRKGNPSISSVFSCFHSCSQRRHEILISILWWLHSLQEASSFRACFGAATRPSLPQISSWPVCSGCPSHSTCSEVPLWESVKWAWTTAVFRLFELVFHFRGTESLALTLRDSTGLGSTWLWQVSGVGAREDGTIPGWTQAAGAGKEGSQTTEGVLDTEGIPKAQSTEMPHLPQDQRKSYMTFTYNFNIN